MVAAGYGESVTKRGASVYARAGNLYVASSDQTQAGFWIESPPYLAMPVDSDPADIGRAVRWALDASQGRVPTPHRDDYPKPSENRLLKLAGFKGWRTFARGARYVFVGEEDGRISIAPSQTTERGAFDFLPDRELIVENPSPVQLGGTIRQALSRCETFGER
jgi:hypothetical protein